MTGCGSGIAIDSDGDIHPSSAHLKRPQTLYPHWAVRPVPFGIKKGLGLQFFRGSLVARFQQ
jgi:hypothetical protein